MLGKLAELHSVGFDDLRAVLLDFARNLFGQSFAFATVFNAAIDTGFGSIFVINPKAQIKAIAVRPFDDGIAS
jgi:hypothetical protein